MVIRTLLRAAVLLTITFRGRMLLINSVRSGISLLLLSCCVDALIYLRGVTLVLL